MALLPVLQIGPGFFLALLLASLLLGFLLIVLQINNDSGAGGEAITMLSGEVIPAVQETPVQINDDRQLNLWVGGGKVVFFFLSIFILVFWFRLSRDGLPKEWWDKGYSLLLYMFAYGSAGYDYAHARQDFAFGDYGRMIGHGLKMRYDFAYISYPWLMSLPYSGFIYWALRGRRVLSGFTDDD